MIEHPESTATETSKRWKLRVGPKYFEEGPLKSFSDDNYETALREFRELREITSPLVRGAATIPAMAMRPGRWSLLPLMRYLPSLFQIVKNGVEISTGTFAPFMNGPLFKVTDPWLRNWLDALAFSLSGLPAEMTGAAAMAYVLFDMHREGAALDYPRGGLGEVVQALVRGVEQDDVKDVTGKEKRKKGSKVHLRRHVESIDTNEEGDRVIGLTVRKAGGRKEKIVVKAREGVVCNVPLWSLKKLIKNENALRILSGGFNDSSSQGIVSYSFGAEPNQSWMTVSKDFVDSDSGRRSVLRPNPCRKDIKQSTNNFLAKLESAEMTGSFLHLHVALNATGLDLDTLLPHYTVMDRGLEGDGTVINGVPDGPCGELNMIAVSNPCVLDRELAPEGFIVMHAYGAGNEPYDIWRTNHSSNRTNATNPKNMLGEHHYGSSTYEALKSSRAIPLWRAIESIIPHARDRAVLALIGSPFTHERYLRRPFGTYGAASEDCLKDGSTPIANLVLCGDGVFPGIGVPAVALSGASAANGMVGVWEQWLCLDELKRRSAID